MYTQMHIVHPWLHYNFTESTAHKKIPQDQNRWLAHTQALLNAGEEKRARYVPLAHVPDFPGITGNSILSVYPREW